MVTYTTNLTDIDWEAVRQTLISDDFHNGRTTEQLKLSFENSHLSVIVTKDSDVIGTARMLSDRVGNAYVVDVWTLTAYREQGIATEMMKMLIDAVPGQHIYLQADDAADFYRNMGFNDQPTGLSMISGDYLKNDT
jgi:predicted GNAT family acetyltransferase